jgi:hypothetical protein
MQKAYATEGESCFGKVNQDKKVVQSSGTCWCGDQLLAKQTCEGSSPYNCTPICPE